jgi:hypothetical protein
MRKHQMIAALLCGVLLAGCEIHPRTIREYRTTSTGQVVASDVTEDQYWKERVDERIAREIKGEKPESYGTWPDYYHWWYGVLRRQPKPTWKSKEFKTSEELVAYIKEKRRARGLPAYD